jgi:hypothetical protein
MDKYIIANIINSKYRTTKSCKQIDNQVTNSNQVKNINQVTNINQITNNNQVTSQLNEDMLWLLLTNF